MERENTKAQWAAFQISPYENLLGLGAEVTFWVSGVLSKTAAPRTTNRNDEVPGPLCPHQHLDSTVCLFLMVALGSYLDLSLPCN